MIFYGETMFRGQNLIIVKLEQYIAIPLDIVGFPPHSRIVKPNGVTMFQQQRINLII